MLPLLVRSGRLPLSNVQLRRRPNAHRLADYGRTQHTNRHVHAAGPSSGHSHHGKGLGYHRIAPGEIRLLNISNRPSEASLNFDLDTYTLDHAPPYTALSYEWGGRTLTDRILLNGHDVSVGRNLWSALSHVRGRVRTDHLWVDALSINQQDILERNTQVQLMDQIYRNAEGVVAWLGLPHVLSQAQPSRTSSGESDWSLAENFLEIATRPYWDRMWVVQELLVAKHVDILVGQHIFDFEYLKSLVVTNYGSARGPQRDKKFPGITPFLQSRDPDRFPQWRQPLYDLLLDYKDKKCSDPRDKVFSLLSLLPDHERRMLGQLFPDYALSHEEVVAITLACLKSTGGQKITSRSHDLFKALGIGSEPKRQELIARSRQFDSHFATTTNDSNFCITQTNRNSTPRSEIASRHRMQDTRNIQHAMQVVLDSISARSSPAKKRTSIAVICVAIIGIYWHYGLS